MGCFSTLSLGVIGGLLGGLTNSAIAIFGTAQAHKLNQIKEPAAMSEDEAAQHAAVAEVLASIKTPCSTPPVAKRVAVLEMRRDSMLQRVEYLRRARDDCCATESSLKAELATRRRNQANNHNLDLKEHYARRTKSV